MLSERQKMILSAIVDDYIRSAEPVGSRSISKRGGVAFSPATIRNEMSDLEELGYLEQPHTSAGRIPSEKGYRYYVDHLLTQGALTRPDLNLMKTFFAERLQEMEQVIQQVATMLSGLTNYTSIVLGPEVFNTTLRMLQVVPLDEASAVAIIVTSTGQVENKVFRIPPGVRMEEIEKFVRILNERLKGVPLFQLRSKIYTEISEELSKHVSGYDDLLQVFEEVVVSDKQDRIFLAGSTNLLVQPEFKDVERVKSFLDLLEETPTLFKIIGSAPEGLQVRIGSENTIAAINNCSLITATYAVDGKTLGTIGILGPTRMEYGKVIGILNHFSQDMAQLMQRWYK
ncbi:heat-inducible transcriptional repressor HrcA [Paenibacillus sp. YN15]|uniref:heat-inducible transcriptional repressor HrcA n=1 Tax=Paenibacillus sp. YN15 TaxID=1742774 RepID=UPI000DCF15F0|nr:heat-inducible transcriptional repressor HrcA [Paenibacillus sp. YN15]RAU94188.1 heat-inducible transcriptional repressor HrcA [Paenibacillus sp. YN15]